MEGLVELSLGGFLCKSMGASDLKKYVDSDVLSALLCVLTKHCMDLGIVRLVLEVLSQVRPVEQCTHLSSRTD